jgi:glucokinase
MILAGDIGGTSTRLAYFELRKGRLAVLAERTYHSREQATLESAVKKFIIEQNIRAEVACFGIAGPVRDRKVETPNLPWHVDAAVLERELGIAQVFLLNDLEANAHGLSELTDADYGVLAAGASGAIGNRAVISAGTGLGEAGLYWDGAAHHPFPCEGGHADFAPTNDLQIELLQYLMKKFGHVSIERVLSGPGLYNIYQFLRDTRKGEEEPWLREEMKTRDPSACVSEYGLSGKSPLCELALDVFVDIYGAEAGNFGLKTMALGGVYVGGGIAPKILRKLQQPRFMQAFKNKGRLGALLEQMPVRVILNDKTALLGAAHVALSHEGVAKEANAFAT